MHTTAEQYQALIDAETWEFIARTETWYPPETIDFTIQKQRDIYDAMCREFYQGHPPGISTTDAHIDGADYSVPVRHYRNDNSGNSAVRLVYFHGGGFVVGGLQSHDDVCSEISAATGLPVTAVDYRLSPEHQHPAAFHDAMTVVAALANDSQLILCGDSAGGNLAASVCHAMRAQTDTLQQLLGQVLIYPGLGGQMDRGSYLAHASAPMLSTQEVRFYSMIRTGGTLLQNDPTLAPLHDTDFSGLPQTLVVSAECDPLSDDGRDYCERISQSGGKAQWINEPGLVHGYLRARTTVTRARESFERILDTIHRWCEPAP